VTLAFIGAAVALPAKAIALASALPGYGDALPILRLEVDDVRRLAHEVPSVREV
jgi:hypothetical protein